MVVGCVITFSTSFLKVGKEGWGVAFWVAAGVKVFQTGSFFFSRPSRGFSAVGASVTTAGAAGTVTSVAIGTSRAPAHDRLRQKLA